MIRYKSIFYFLYLFFMKNFFYLIVLFFLQYSYVSAGSVWEKESETTGSNIGIIIDFFTTDLLINIFFAIIIIIITIVSAKIISSRMLSYIEHSWEWENREEMAGVISRTINITILIVGFTVTLSVLGVDLTIFMWGLWFWIGFTLKIFFSNFITWIIMVTQWSYHNWDLIEIDWKIWNIKRINALFTEVTQFDGVVFSIPNVRFLEVEVRNYNTNDTRRVDINIWVDYDTDILKAKKIMLQVLNNFDNIIQSPSADVYFTEMWDSSIKLSLRFWIDSTWEHLKIRSNVTETINLAFKQTWIKVAFPQVSISNR